MKVRIYTDGSFSNNYNIGSWAIVICEERKVRTYSGIVRNGSNNQMELKAINEALAFSFLKNYNDVEIFTDSAYVINNIERQTYKEWERNNWKNVKGENIKNYKEWIEFIKYKIIFDKNNINVKFTKVKSHSNNSFNNLADREAKAKIQNYLERRGIKNG